MFIESLNQTDREPMTVYQILRSASYDDGVEYSADELIERYAGTLWLNDPGSYNLLPYMLGFSLQRYVVQHYLMRRIGFNTLTEFRLALENKFNDIKPVLYGRLQALLTYDSLGVNTQISYHTHESHMSGSGESDDERALYNFNVDKKYKNMETITFDIYESDHEEAAADSNSGSESSTNRSSGNNSTNLTKSDTTINKSNDTPQGSTSISTYGNQYQTSTLSGTDTTTGSSSDNSSSNASSSSTNSSDNEHHVIDSKMTTTKDSYSYGVWTTKRNSDTIAGTSSSNDDKSGTQTTKHTSNDPDSYNKLYSVLSAKYFDIFEYLWSQFDELFLNVEV